MSSSIPRRLLVHSATLSPYTGTVNGVKTYGEPVDLKFVRFEPVKQSNMGTNGESKADRFVMIYDSRNSTPTGASFFVNDKITFAGFDLTVRKVAFGIDDTSNVHHQEVTLV